MNDTRNREVALPVPPQALALQVYMQLMTGAQRDLDAKKIDVDEFCERVKNAVVATIECACRAQREAMASLFEVLADASPDLQVRQVAPNVAGIIRGEVKPEVVKDRDAMSRLVLPGQDGS